MGRNGAMFDQTTKEPRNSAVLLSTPIGVHGAPCRPTSRTSSETQLRQLDDLAETLREPTVKDLVAQLSDIMLRHHGSEK